MGLAVAVEKPISMTSTSPWLLPPKNEPLLAIFCGNALETSKITTTTRDVGEFGEMVVLVQ